MTAVDYFFQIIELAALPDNEATDVLNRRLSSLADEDDEETLLYALVWLDPQLAWQCYNSRPATRGDADYLEGWLESYTESAQLATKSREELVAYRSITALLPKDSEEREKRVQIQGLACARSSPIEFLGSSEWETCLSLNFFLFARLWLQHPEALHKAIQKLTNSSFWPGHYNCTGQILLVAGGRPEDIPQLIELVQECAQESLSRSNALLSHSISRVLDFLEMQGSQEIEPLLPDLVTMIGAGREAGGVELTARVLIQIDRLGLDSTYLLQPLKERVEADRKRREVRSWLRNTARQVIRLAANLTSAQELVYILRLLLLARRLEETLLKEKKKATPARIRCAWGWLQRSERFIATISDPFWLEQLLEKKASLERQVRESRRPVHLAVIAQEPA